MSRFLHREPFSPFCKSLPSTYCSCVYGRTPVSVVPYSPRDGSVNWPWPHSQCETMLSCEYRNLALERWKLSISFPLLLTSCSCFSSVDCRYSFSTWRYFRFHPSSLLLVLASSLMRPSLILPLSVTLCDLSPPSRALGRQIRLLHLLLLKSTALWRSCHHRTATTGYPRFIRELFHRLARMAR